MKAIECGRLERMTGDASGSSPGDQPRLVGTGEVRALAGGVSRQLVDQWAGRADFPRPVQVLSDGRRLWDEAAVLAWLAQPRPNGRPRRSRAETAAGLQALLPRMVAPAIYDAGNPGFQALAIMVRDASAGGALPPPASVETRVRKALASNPAATEHGQLVQEAAALLRARRREQTEEESRSGAQNQAAAEAEEQR